MKEATKLCATCGRVIEWRKKWAANWDDVRYCSSACRKAKPNSLDRRMEEAILDALAATPAHEIPRCDPEEVVAHLDDDGRGDLRERARRAARRLAARGDVEIVQDGRPVDPSTARGNFAVRLAK